MWLCATVAMGMNITNSGKLFYYGFNIYHYYKLTGIRKLSEWFTLDFFNNNLTNDTGNLSKKTST